MLRFGKKMPCKILYFAKHKKHIYVGSGSGSSQLLSFLGHPNPDPDIENRIHGSRSEKNGPDLQHWQID